VQVERIEAEKRLRKVAGMPLLGMAFFAEREDLKRLCKDLLTRWGAKRRIEQTQGS
jgi:hypothetical protein